VVGKHGVLPSRVDMFGLGGNAQLDALEFPDGYMARLDSLRDLIEVYDREINDLDRRIVTMLANRQGYRAIQAIHGVGPILAAVFVAEIGDITRHPSPAHLASWAGTTPPPRVRHQSPTRQDLQAGLPPRALGSGRGRVEEPR
jgi:transposase